MIENNQSTLGGKSFDILGSEPEGTKIPFAPRLVVPMPNYIRGTGGIYIIPDNSVITENITLPEYRL